MASKKTWVTIAIIVVALAALGLGANAYMSTPGFCASCHEMKPSAAMWEKSPHKAVNCLECHSEPGFAGFVKEKMTGMQETWAHITGNYETPIKGEAFESRCLECHKNWKDINEGEQVKIPHGLHADMGAKCATCHSSVAHGVNLPDGKKEATFTPNHDTCAQCHQEDLQSNCAKCHKNM